MNFLVITSATTLIKDGKRVAYAPYVREMNIWFKHADNIAILSPTSHQGELLTSEFEKELTIFSIPSLAFNRFFRIIKSLFYLPIVIYKMIRAMIWADHIHLRCPGNVGLFGCFVQILFPKKTKTAKYAGNWDPKAKQPLSYKLQKWLLSNTFLTKNMTVLVYGKWENQSKNIKPFFTATFKEEEKEKPQSRVYDSQLRFVFAGSLVKGKRPLLAIKIIEKLQSKGYDAHLDFYGDGILRNSLSDYIETSQISNITLHGNQDKEIIKNTLKAAHFLILPSKSEGWPKVVAEAMFFGAIPIVTDISCVSYMLDYGKRGIIISSKLDKAYDQIVVNLEDKNELKSMSTLASKWSQNYTLERFDNDIKKLIQ